MGSPTSGSADFALAGAQFDLAGTFFDGGAEACLPCAAGSQLITISYRNGGDMAGRVAATVDGTRYDAIYLGGYFVVTGKVAIPANTGTFTVTFPFSIAPGSFVVGYTDPGRTTQAFRFDLNGSGTATMTVQAIGGGIYQTAGVVFAF